MMLNAVRSGFILNIFTNASEPMISASHAIRRPSPKQSLIVSRSFVKSDIRLPTLFT